jgi:hypothetical protein
LRCLSLPYNNFKPKKEQKLEKANQTKGQIIAGKERFCWTDGG